MTPKAPRPVQIPSWLALAQLAAACASGRWIFRGETLTVSREGTLLRNPLRPKAGRVGSQKGSARKTPYQPKDEERSLADFMRQARPHLGHTPASAGR